jgi:putative nucleotidyltransferase with HDIG domain
MLKEQEIENNKQNIIKWLNNTQRKGMDNLIKYLEEVEFFSCPCSTKYHGNYRGGLADHSINVAKTAFALVKFTGIKVDSSSLFIVSLLHDLCKAKSYVWNEDGSISRNKNADKGHGELSVKRIKQFIELTEVEENMIRYHMGMYGSKEFSSYYIAEYTIQELSQKFNQNTLYKIFYISDEIATIKEGVESAVNQETRKEN